MVNVYRLILSLLAVTAALCLASPDARAELDLVPDGSLLVSGVEIIGGMMADRAGGRGALRDENSSTVWKPNQEGQVYIELDLSSSGEDVRLELERIELDWGEDWPESLIISGGPDRHTQSVIANIIVDDPDYLEVIPAMEVKNLRVLRLTFSDADFSLARLSVFASTSPEMEAEPGLDIADSGGDLELSWTAVAGAHHYLVERSVDGVEEATTILRSTGNITRDRSPAAGHLRYRVRAVDYLGHEGPWFGSADVAGYDPGASPEVRLSGVVEGFYGPPWSHRTRMKVLRWMGIWGMNAYIYAPKDAPKHRLQWRERYLEDELDQFAELLAVGRASGIEVYYGISPGNDIDPLLEDDFKDLTDKLQQLLDLGYRRFVLLMDDIDAKVDRSLGENHAGLTDRLHDWLLAYDATCELLFVPAVYSGTEGSFNQNKGAYLESLESIPQEVTFAWTGEDTFDEEITANELAGFAEKTGHNIWLWDNYPVNDFDLGLGVYLAPVRGRGADLLSAPELDGVLSNPMAEGMASLFAISSYASLIEDPEYYDPESFGVDAVRAALDPDFSLEDWQVLRGFFTRFQDFADMENAPQLTEDLSDFIELLSLGTLGEVRTAAEELTAECLAIIKMARAMDEGILDREFSDEMSLHLQKLAAAAEASLISLNLLQADLLGLRSALATDDQRLANLVKGELAWLLFGGEPVFDELIDLAGGPAEDRPDARFAGESTFEAIAAHPLAQARIGQEWIFDAGFRLSDDIQWSVSAPEALAASIDGDGLLSLRPGMDSVQNPLPGEYMISLKAEYADVTYTQFYFVDLCTALHDGSGDPLDLTTELTSVDGLPVLMQNDLVMPDPALSQWSRLDLSGPWQKRRMALDRNLSFAKRTDEVLAMMEAESGGAVLPTFDDSEWETQNLPSVENRLCPTGHPSGPEHFTGGVWYRRDVELPVGGQAIRLVLPAAGYTVDVWADGLYLGYHEGSYTPVYLPLPQSLDGRDRVTLLIRIDNPPPGFHPSMLPAPKGQEHMNYTGIFYGIYWEFVPSMQKATFARVKAEPLDSSGSLGLEIIVQDFDPSQSTATLLVEAFEANQRASSYWSGGSIAAAMGEDRKLYGEIETNISLRTKGLSGLRLEVNLKGAESWTPDSPKLYVIRLQLLDSSQRLLDAYHTQVGFRTLEIDEDGVFLLNDKPAFLPGMTRIEDSAGSGRAMTLDQIRADLARVKNMGTRLLHTGPFPNHPNTYIMADRLGLAVIAEIPTQGLGDDDYESQQDRPLARQMWREMIFTLVNRPSVFFWGVCHNCDKSTGETSMADFISGLHKELDNVYPDGRLVIQSLQAEATEDIDMTRAVEKTDLLGISLLQESGNSEEKLLELLRTIHAGYPLKPLFVSQYGAPSGLTEDGLYRQVETAERLLDAAGKLASVTEKGQVNEEGFLVGALWWSLYDWYGLQGPVSGGMFYMNRYTWKPVADQVRSRYRGFGSIASNRPTTGVPPNTVNTTSCSQSSPLDAAALMMLLAMLILFRYKPIRNGR